MKTDAHAQRDLASRRIPAPRSTAGTTLILINPAAGIAQPCFVGPGASCTAVAGSFAASAGTSDSSIAVPARNDPPPMTSARRMRLDALDRNSGQPLNRPAVQTHAKGLSLSRTVSAMFAPRPRSTQKEPPRLPDEAGSPSATRSLGSVQTQPSVLAVTKLHLARHAILSSVTDRSRISRESGGLRLAESDQPTLDHQHRRTGASYRGHPGWQPWKCVHGDCESVVGHKVR